METNLQRILKTCDNSFEMAKKYYCILFELNNIKISKSELDLIAYSSIHGTISTPPVRDEFMKDFDVSIEYFYNIISKLKKLNILIKDKDKKVRINPAILPDFSKNIVLAIKLSLNGN